MTDVSAQARLAAARRKLGDALGQQFQGKLTYRQGTVDYAEYDDNGRLIRATMTVDGVANVPVIAGAGEALHVGDAIQVQNRGTPAAPMYKYDYHIASAYGDAGVSPAAVLSTPTGLALTTTLRRPTTGGQVAAITATWNALPEMVMGSGGYYEVEIKRDDEVLTGDGHVSRCPHRLGSTALNGSATYGDATVTVDDTSTFPAAGKFKVAEATVTYTGRTATTFTGCSWTGGSGTYANDTGVTGTTQSLLLDHLLTGVDFNVRVRAVSASGATSAWSAWASVKTPGNMQLTVQDSFSTYARPDLSDLASLCALRLAGFEAAESWTMGTPDTTHVKEGARGYKCGSGDEVELTVALNMSTEQRFTDADFVGVDAYATGPISNTYVVFKHSLLPENYHFDWPLAAGWNHLKAKRGDASVIGSPDWAAIIALTLGIPDEGADATFDHLWISKADPDDPTTYNDTGKVWDFLPLQGSGSEWHVLPGKQTGEPDRDYSLAQLLTAASPSNWLLAWNTLTDIYYGTAAAGFYLKGIDGQAMLAWNIQDPAVATRTMYAAELDTATNHVRLVKWISGTRTQIAEADFTSAPNQIVQLGVDFRDFEEEGRIKVYATLTEGNVFLGSNMVISVTDTDIDRGSYVGVGFKECNGRVVDFRAGSPQHSMTAEHAFHAALADRALLADVATTSSAVDLNGVTDALVLDADGDTVIDADTDDQINFKAGGADRMTLTAAGLALASGARLNEFSTDGTMAGDSDTAAPTEKAVRAYAGRWTMLTTPATSTSWDGDAKNAASGTIDLSAVFGIPAGVKAIAVVIEAGDESANVEFGLGPSATYYDAVSQRTNVANFHIKCAGIVPCDANGDVYFYQGSELDFVLIRIYGYAV